MRRSVTKRSLLLSLSVEVMMLGVASGLAQTPPAAPSLQNQPAPASQLIAPESPVVGGSVSTAGPPVTPALAAGSNQSSSLGKSFGSAGQGLPGMPGGPAVNSAVGAQDPSGRYMRPPVIPPLLCDPAVDLPC
jgi:hypothetical protein